MLHRDRTARASENRLLSRLNLFVACLIGCLALFELEKMINFPGMDPVFDVLNYVQYALLVYVLCFASLRKNKWYFLLLAGMLLLVLTSLIKGVDVLEKTVKYLNRGVLVLLLFPSVGILLPPGGRKGFLRVFLGLWILFIAAVCILGIISVSGGTTVSDVSGQRQIMFSRSRLGLFFSSTITAANLSMALMMALVNLHLYRRKWIKAVNIILMIPMFVCLALTNGRAGYITSGIGFGLALVCLFREKLLRAFRKKWIACLACVLVFAFTASFVVFAHYQIVRSYNSLTAANRTAWVLLPSASAGQSDGVSGAETDSAKETEAPSSEKKTTKTKKKTTTKKTTTTKKKTTTIQSRSLINSNTLSGRDTIWRDAFETLKGSPEILLTGTSAPLIMDYYNQYSSRPNYFYHMHNYLLQILMETGLCGFGLAACFLWLFFRGAWRLARNPSLPLWQRTLFLPALAGILIETVECLMWLQWSSHSQVIVMLFSGLTLVLSRQEKISG